MSNDIPTAADAGQPSARDDQLSARDEMPADATPARLTPAARRALDEARERRETVDERARQLAARHEKGGRGGLDPVRYEDWEVAGRAIDF